MPVPLDLPDGSLLLRRLLKGTWAEQEQRPFSNSFELRLGIDTGLSVYLAAVTNEADILSGITGAGLVALVYDEVKSCFDVFPSDGEENPALAAGHVELRVRGLEQGSQIPRKKQRDLAKFAGAGLMVLPASKV